MTAELALSPRGASFERGDFDWRISAASVVEDGPFSLFPGFERVLVVTRGAGLVLTHGAVAKPFELDPLVPHRFDGGVETRARLLADKVEDFNVICRRGRVRAEVEVWTGGVARSLPPVEGEHVFAHVLEGELLARTGLERREWRIRSGESLCAPGPQEVLELRLDAGKVIVVCLADLAAPGIP